MKNVLFVTHHYLFGNGGACFASRAYINAFAQIAEKVTLLYPYKEGFEAQYINLKVRLLPIEYKKSKFLKIWDVIRGNIHRYRDVFSDILYNDIFDTVVFDNSCVSYKLIDVAIKLRLKVITIHHNFEYEYKRDDTPIYIKPFVLYWVKKYEKEAFLKSDLNLTLTKQDAELLINAYGNPKRVEVIGTFEYEKYNASELNDAMSEKYCFAITGSLASRQTEKSLIPFLKTYYPIIENEIPNHKLLIAGRNPSKKLVSVCAKHKNIDLIPNPVKMSEVTDRACFFICPTCLGGGLKLRIMDGLKAGLPVLTHVVSARGYDKIREKGLLISYSNKENFRKGLHKLLSLKVDKAEILQEFTNEFSFDAGVNRMKNIFGNEY